MLLDSGIIVKRIWLARFFAYFLMASFISSLFIFFASGLNSKTMKNTHVFFTEY